MRIHRSTCLISLLALLPLCPISAAVKEGRASQLLRSLRESAPDESRAVTVSNVSLKLGLGTLIIEKGVLIPAVPVEGRTLEYAFTGDAWFRFATHDPVESRQLEVFTGKTGLMAPITDAVLVAAEEKPFEAVLKGEPASGDATRQAAKMFRTWVESPERQGFAADLSMVKSLLGDSTYRGYAAAWCRSPELGDFYYFVDPAQSEPVTLGKFVPMDMSRLDVWQQRYIKSIIRLYFLGRYAEFSAEHPGDWDTWVSTYLRSPEGERIRGAASPEAEHYTIDLYVNPKVKSSAKGTARIRVRITDSVRSLAFSLYSGLKVTAVTGPDKAPIDFIQREGRLHVFLPEALPPGSSFEVQIAYEGNIMETVVYDEAYALIDTLRWHPQIGDIDRATYDVTLRRPRGFSLLASGKAAGSGEENGVAWERRTLELPAIGFTFELGRFEILRERVGHVDLTFGFPPNGGPRKEAKERLVATVKRCLPVFEEKFGPYPLDYMTVVTVDRGFSQGLLSMVTLAEGAVQTLQDETNPHLQKWAEERSVVTIAHELSHQWWGNWVGWKSYRDQWLSEALASYSGLQFGLESADQKAAFMGRNALDWRASLTMTTSEGRTVESLGPVTMGARLYSSKSRSAYNSIVYDKGEVVFRMLSRNIGEEKFAQMLGELARSVANRVIDTETFMKAFGRMSSLDLGPFAEQFVYGTGIPDIYYRYEVQPKENGSGYTIRGEARRAERKHEVLRFTQEPPGKWHVVRQEDIGAAAPASNLLVPFHVIVTSPDSLKPRKPGEIQSARGFGGKLTMTGDKTSFQINVAQKPERFEFDQFGEVLAMFHDEGWTPKRTLRAQALDLGRAGDMGGAMNLLQKALQVPLYSERAIAWMNPKRREALDKNKAEETRFEDARIHTLMARLLVDHEDFGRATEEIAAAEKLLDSPESQAGSEDRMVLRGRIQLARGNPEAAYQHLRKGLQRWRFSTEGYAYLALAALDSGHQRIARQALEEAESRGVDVRELRQARLTTAKHPG